MSPLSSPAVPSAAQRFVPPPWVLKFPDTFAFCEVAELTVVWRSAAISLQRSPRSRGTVPPKFGRFSRRCRDAVGSAAQRAGGRIARTPGVGGGVPALTPEPQPGTPGPTEKSRRLGRVSSGWDGSAVA